MLEIGSLVDGKYRILDEVGRGGMSVVYLARNIRTNKQWAIKEVRKDGTNDFDIVRSNLIAETDILKKLEHPNLPNIIDILDDGESFIIIMDFIEGNSLQHYLKHAGAQPEEDVVEWGIQLCDVLGYLHSRQPPIIYRDMKPSNVMLKPDGNICLIDFGTAREYKETSIEDTKCLGTQGYAAPEQYGGHGQTDARTDIYCLGATLYHLVTGHNPAEPPYEMYPIRQWNPALSEGLEYIILKCTQKDPANRFQNCEELMYALQHRDAYNADVRKAQRRKIRLTAISLILTLVFFAGWITMGSLKKSAEADSYNARISAAANANSVDSAMNYLSDAVQLSPKEPDAYSTLLEVIIKDDSSISSDEADDMQALLYGNSKSSSTNMETFKAESPEEYYAFCYKYGMYLFALYDGNYPNAAKPFLAEAAGATADQLDQKKIDASEYVYDLCMLYEADNAALDLDNTGDANYTEYWNSICNLVNLSDADADALFSGNAIGEAKLYNFVITEISKNALKFKSAGVSIDDMEAAVTAAGNKIDHVRSDHTNDNQFNAHFTSTTNADEIKNKLEAFR